MIRRFISPFRVWVLLVVLTFASLAVAEQITLRAIAQFGIFAIAAIKGQLVIEHYMEARLAERHWQIMYSIWILVVTLLLTWGHIASAV